MKKYVAECIGTMVLTLLGCGTAVFLGCGTSAGVVGTAITFGLSVVAMAYAIGGIVGALLLWLIVKTTGAPGAMGDPAGLGTNGVANAGGAGGAFLVEVIATFIFVFVVLGTTDSKKGAGNLAGLAIGLTLILVHLVCINLTGTSVNPARSIGPALFVGGDALKDLWVFIVAPLVGGAIAACTWCALAPTEEK